MDSPDFEFHPPSPDRVAARALVLAAVSCRALIENGAGQPQAEDLLARICEWLQGADLATEVEGAESQLFTTQLGQLPGLAAVNASWRSEGMVVLAWALGRADLPAYHTECDPSGVADLLGFLDDPASSALSQPSLRPHAEIEHWADSYLTLHWRLRQFSLHHRRINFVTFVQNCTWGPLSLEELELVDDDLAIEGTRVDRLAEPRFRQALSITQERHQALNWLLGEDPVYSKVATDT